MDRFGVDVIAPMDTRVETVAALCERGYAERMVLSHDANCHSDWFPEEFHSLTPRWHFTHIHDDVIPALLARGVTDAQIDAMLVGNPRRYFAGS